MKKAVVTGATGAIGRALISELIREGFEVLAIVHRISFRANELEMTDHCRVLRLDLNEYGQAAEHIRREGLEDSGYMLFFHLAWMAPFGADRDNLTLQLDNVKASLDAVRLARELGCTTFIGTGSQAEYGRTEGVLRPDTPTLPETGYGITKLCAGQLTRLACTQCGLRHIWCRVLSVYGPYDRDQTLISTAVISMMKNEETEFTPCDQMWDYIYSDDAARAIILAGMKGTDGGIYMIGGGQVRPLKEYIKEIADMTGYRRPIGFGKRPYNDKQVMYLEADITELEKIGFKTKVSFKEGIEKTLLWQQNRLQKKGAEI